MLKPDNFTWPYYFMHLICRLSCYVFYRRIHIVGKENFPMEGPVIICGTHSNQFVDAIMLIAKSPRMVHFVIADSAWKKKYLVYFLSSLPLIRTKRPQDESKPGKGSITAIKGDIIHGERSTFTKCFKEKDTISIPNLKAKFFILKVLDDTRLEVDNSESIHFEGGSENFIIIPKIDQHGVFEESWKVLGEGKVIGIFPEGGSHDQLGLLPLKAGACIMAFGAEVEYGVSAKIIPCGLNYYNPDKFRSTAVIEYGEPFCAQEEDIKKYLNKDTKKEIIAEFLERLTENLKDVKITAENFPELMCIYTARNIITDDLPRNAETEKVYLFKKLKDCLEKSKGTQDSESILDRLNEYRKMLKHIGIKDWQLKTLDNSFLEGIRTFIISFLWVIITVTIAFPAIAYTIPQRILLRYIAEKNRVKALKESKVKVSGKDVVASFKFLYGVPLTLLSANIVNLIYLFCFSQKISDCWLIRLLTLPFFTIIFSTYIILMIRFHNGLNTHFRICIIRLFVLIYKRRIKSLTIERARLKTQLLDFMDRFGKMKIEKYENQKKFLMKRQSTQLHIDTEEAWGVLAEIG